MKNLTFDDLELDMRVFDMEEQSFGTIIGKDDEDKEWLMIEVQWDNDDPKIDDRSYVLSGKQIGVEVKAGTPMMDDILKHMGDEINAVAEEHGEEFSIVNLVDIW